MYRIIRLFSHQRQFVPEIVPLWLKNRNQRVHAGGLMRGVANMRRGGLIRGVTQLLRKGWTCMRGEPMCGRGEGVAYRRGIMISQTIKYIVSHSLLDIR